MEMHGWSWEDEGKPEDEVVPTEHPTLQPHSLRLTYYLNMEYWRWT